MSSRRNFLKTGLFASTLMAVPPEMLYSYGLSETRKKVVIIGAGMAGLAAADALLKHGHEVTILEAQLRAGGRVQTFRQPFADDLYADMGAARIPENHHLTIKYVKDLNLELIPFLPSNGSDLHMIRGQKLRYKGNPGNLSDYPILLKDHELALGWPGISSVPFEKILREVGNPKSPHWPHSAIRHYDEMNFSEFLTSQGYSSGIRDLLLLGYVERSPYDVSMLEWIRELALSFGTPRYRIKGGNDLLPKRLSERLSMHIQYGCEVLDVRQSDSKVTVTFNRYKELRNSSADYVICTLPLGVLKRSPFVQHFSGEKYSAIRDMNVFPLSRTVLQCKSAFWKEDGLSGSVKTDLPSEIWDPCYEKNNTRRLLTCYFKGSTSSRLDEETMENRGAFTSKHIKDIFSNATNNVEGAISKQWANDKWSGGGTVLAGVGDMVKCQPNLAKPEGRVHFAGEHTSAYHGWIQGAIESGLRAAAEIDLRD